MSAAKDKGSAVQRNTAAWYQRIWPYATTQGAGVAGRDIQHVPVSIEVKARRSFQPLEWMRQVRKAARPQEDELPPWVVMCPYGLGEDKCEDFLVIQRLEDHTALVEELLAFRRRRDLARQLKDVLDNPSRAERQHSEEKALEGWYAAQESQD